MATISQDSVSVPGAPAIRGLCFRRFQGEADFAVMAAIVQATKEVDQIEHGPTADDIKRYCTSHPTLNCSQDILIAEVSGEAVGYSSVITDTDGDGVTLYIHRAVVVPYWRRRGLGHTFLRFNEARLRAIAASRAVAGPEMFEVIVSDTQPDKEVLLQSEGYTPCRFSYEMTRSLLEPIADAPLPPDFELRPVQPEQYEAILQALNEAFLDHWSFVPITAEQFQKLVVDNPHANMQLWHVAWAGEEVAGMVLNDIDPVENAEYQRRQGWVSTVCVRRSWRGRGLARALLAKSLSTLRAHGMTEAALGVDAENQTGALRLYKNVGFQVSKRYTFYRKPLELRSEEQLARVLLMEETATTHAACRDMLERSVSAQVADADKAALFAKYASHLDICPECAADHSLLCELQHAAVHARMPESVPSPDLSFLCGTETVYSD